MNIRLTRQMSSLQMTRAGWEMLGLRRKTRKSESVPETLSHLLNVKVMSFLKTEKNEKSEFYNGRYLTRVSRFQTATGLKHHLPCTA